MVECFLLVVVLCFYKVYMKVNGQCVRFVSVLYVCKVNHILCFSFLISLSLTSGQDNDDGVTTPKVQCATFYNLFYFESRHSTKQKVRNSRQQ